MNEPSRANASTTKSMRRTAIFAALLWLLLASALLSCKPAAALPHVSPEETGLTWRECPAPAVAREAEEACLGELPSRPGAGERGGSPRMGVRVEGGLRLTIGADTYRTRHLGLGVLPGWPWDPYVLFRNKRPVGLLWGEVQVHDPEITLQNIAGRAAWEFADPRQATVIYDGKDLRGVYGLDAAYRPHELAGRLIFVGRKAGQYFLVYDGRRVGPAFDEISIAYCCEAVLYAPRGGERAYRFWGRRDGELYVVEVKAEMPEFAVYLLEKPLSPADVAGADPRSLALRAEPILAADDIVAYSWREHALRLTPEATARLAALQVPTDGVGFVVCAAGEPVYLGAFWTLYSSQSYNGVAIQVPPVGEALRIQLGYPESPELFAGPDPRWDARVRRALESAGKLQD